MTTVVQGPAKFRALCDRARNAGKCVGVVPTMGALHDGHVALMDHAKAQGAEFLVATVFVNPLQFEEGEDLERYPRNLKSDVARCQEHGVDVVFAPSTASMYSHGFSTQVCVSGLTDRYEGAHRPGHFDGVTTIVSKLFNLTGPSLAVFGQKDYQQWRVIQRMVSDLDMPIEVIAHPIVREDDGLALSSRNRYLDTTARERALAIWRGLNAAHEAFQSGERNAEALVQHCRKPIEDNFDSIDYIAIAQTQTLEPINDQLSGPGVLLVAAHIDGTRLIDNLVLTKASES